MKSFQILALLIVGSCALISADTGLLRASSEVESAPADGVVQEFALLDQNEKNRVLGGYTEDDDVDMDKDKGYGGMGNGKSMLGYYDRGPSKLLRTSYSHSGLSH
jgi:hypothetical protein